MKTVFSIALFTGLSACGYRIPVESVVSRANLTSYQQNNDNWISAQLTLKTSTFQLSGINLPITSPTDSTKTLAQLTIAPSLPSAANNSGTVTVALDLTNVIKLPTTHALLPNNAPLPITLPENATLTGVVAVPVEATGATIYYMFGSNLSVLGIAIPFAALDTAGLSAPGANIFAPATFGQVSMLAGMFFGSTSKTTGIGVFIDLSTSAAAAATAPAPTNPTASAASQLIRIPFTESRPRSKKERLILKSLLDIAGKKPILKVE